MLLGLGKCLSVFTLLHVSINTTSVHVSMITDDFMRMNRLAMWLTCSECAIIKNGIHDMEVFIISLKIDS